MRSKTPFLLLLFVGWFGLFEVPALAEHRATRLGYPSTRFAKPLSTPEDLRDRFRDPKLRPDIAWVLRDWGWQGNLDDLYRAAESAPIADIKIPIGGRMPFMTTRRDGKPVVLKDVLWVGSEPVPAYAFNFVSNGRRYRCVTPKPCSNFYVEDLGPDKPTLKLVKSAPTDSNLCEPYEVVLRVTNPSPLPATDVKVVDALPPGTKTIDGQTSLSLDAGTLQPGTGVEFRFKIVPSAATIYTNIAQATCAEGITADASAVTSVHAPKLTLECNAPGQVIARRPAQLCLVVSNTGDAPEPEATISLPIPAGTTVTNPTEGGVVTDSAITWVIHNLAAGASQKLCASFTKPELVEMSFAPTLQARCSPPVQSQCLTKVVGVPGVLMEVVDLQDPVQVGEQVTYDIKITNQGYIPITNTQITCILPESQEFISASGVTESHLEGRNLIMQTVPTFAPKAVLSWQVTIRAKKEDDARFNVELRADQYEQPIHENESTRQY
ncbi:MAG TPA: hypothetical protein VMF06_12270 [Candidatus Limnocylindria bacterium]|nr:hypothetical protein [Candidatus Limnocylindria bacterium]